MFAISPQLPHDQRQRHSALWGGANYRQLEVFQRRSRGPPERLQLAQALQTTVLRAWLSASAAAMDSGSAPCVPYFSANKWLGSGAMEGRNWISS